MVPRGRTEYKLRDARKNCVDLATKELPILFLLRLNPGKTQLSPPSSQAVTRYILLREPPVLSIVGKRVKEWRSMTRRMARG